MRTGTIYKITNTVNQRMYIGQTVQSTTIRWKQHVRSALNTKCKAGNTVMARAIRKYGEESFTIETVVAGVPIEWLDAFEKYWINHYNTYTNGYNSTLGGQGSRGLVPWNINKRNHLSPGTKEKMRQAKLGKQPTNLEQLRLLAIERQGLKHPNAKVANVYEYNTNKLIAEHVALTEWCRQHGYNQGNLCSTARKTAKHANGLYAVYIEDIND